MSSAEGRLLTHPAVARRRFAQIAGLPEEELDLLEASLVVALEEYPALTVERYVARVEEWSGAVRQRIDGSRDVERLIEEINRLLFDDEGFRGDAADWYDPRVSFLNEVLDRHAGLPLALSIVWLEIARRLGVESAGVSMPGRFLVKVSGPWGELLIDPFDQGRVLSTVECQRILDQLFGGAVTLREQHLRAAPRREILGHLLSHLKSVYKAQGDLAGMLASVERLLIIDEGDAWEIRDRGAIALQLHRYAEAVEWLERYLEMAPHAEDRDRVRDQVAYLRSWLEC
jgi:regulator of sirC expression with transglutaminase-like and TPR domain